MPIKLLLCSNDALGLGQLRRTWRIATSLVSSVPNLSVLILSGSSTIDGFRFAPGIDCIKLPSLWMEGIGLFSSRRLPLPVEEIKRLRERIILETALVYQPDLLLVDSRPLGIWEELLPTIQAVKQGPKKAGLVLGLRDIVGPDIVQRQWHADRTMPTLETFYDEIWVYGCQALYDPIDEHRFPETVARKVRFCGYVVDGIPTSCGEQRRQELGIAAERFVLVTVGNGGDGFPILDAYLQALEISPSALKLVSMLVGGPEFPPEQEVIVRRRCEDLTRARPDCPVRFLRFFPDLLEYMAAADLVVSMGGYNTLVEILALEKRAIVIPRVSIVREQFIRAALFQRLGLLRMLHPDHLTPEGMADAILSVLDAPPPSRRQLEAAGLDLNGLQQVRNHVRRLLQERGPLSQACR